MKATLTILVALLALSLPAYSLLAAPVNDNFLSAAAYSGTSQIANNTTATAEPGEPAHNPGATGPGHSVWWKYTPQLPGVYAIDAMGSDFDTVLSVYTGSTVSRLTRVGSNDDSGGNGTSLIKLFLQKGITYRIAVDGFGSATGNVTLHLRLSLYYSARTYQGMVDSNDRQLDGTGMVSFVTTSTGALTGRFVLGARAYPFTAGVDDAGVFAASIARPGLVPVVLTATFPLAGFTLSDGVGAACTASSPTFNIRLDGADVFAVAFPSAPGDPALLPYFPAIAPYTTANPCPRAGRYPFMMVCPGATGYGVAVVTVGVTGVCTGSGHLGEGTAFSFTAPLLDNGGSGLQGIGTAGTFVFHQGLYASRGRVTGQGVFDASQTPAVLNGGGIMLRPPPPAGTVLLPQGTIGPVTLYGSRYTPPPAGSRMDAAFNPSGALTYVTSGTPFAIPNETVTLSTANTFTYAAPNPNAVRLVASPATGTVTGSMKLTSTAAAVPVVAVLVHNPTIGTGFYGYVPAVSSYGRVTIKP